MNHEELAELINNLHNVSIQLDDEITQLRELQRIREASRNTGRNASERHYAAHGNDNENQGNRVNSSETGQECNKNNGRKLSVGDSIEVVRGRNQGVRATIVRETAAQFELKSEQVQGNFRKWKNNVKKVKKQRT